VIRLRVLLVCLGNICRSPTAEAVLRYKLTQAGLGALVDVDSAGTGDWHVGQPPDRRSQRHALLRGYDLSRLRGRCVTELDFERFDLIFAMDEDNLSDLERLRPDGGRAELHLFAPQPVPDPYQGGPESFEQVLDLIEVAADGWVVELRRRMGTS
jgi:protein-tyrosine phosphatase